MMKENKETAVLLEFKASVEERQQRFKINDAVLEKRIEKLEKDMENVDSYLNSNMAATGGMNKEEFLELLAKKAEKDINEK